MFCVYSVCDDVCCVVVSCVVRLCVCRCSLLLCFNVLVGLTTCLFACLRASLSVCLSVCVFARCGAMLCVVSFRVDVWCRGWSCSVVRLRARLCVSLAVAVVCLVRRVACRFV